MHALYSFFGWFGGVLSDPNDKQGSTKRLCLFLFLTTIMLLIILVTVASKPMGLPNVPDSILNLVYFVVALLVTGVVADKGIAAWKVIKGGSDDVSADQAAQ